MMQVIITLFLASFVVADISGGAPCTSDIQCGYGTCNFAMNNGTCVCQAAYANVSCNYQRNQQILPFGLTWLCLFGVCGVGRLSVGVLNGIALLILGLFSIFPLYVIACCSCAYQISSCQCNGYFSITIGIVMLIMGLAAFGWFIADLVIFGTLQAFGSPFLDGNGFELLKQF